MRSGNSLGIDLGKSNVDFSSLNTSELPASTIFDWTAGRNHDNYIKIVHPNEMHGLDGQVNGMFYMIDKFNITFIHSGDDETVASVTSHLPHFSKMNKVII